MGGIQITDLMTRYCAAVTPLWNDYFLPVLNGTFPRPEMEAENAWDLRDRYDDACVHLFSGLVLWPLGLHETPRLPSYRGDQEPIPQIRLTSPGGVAVHVTAAGLHPLQGYDYSITSTEQANLDLRFQNFFDFEELKPRTFQWVRAVVGHCVERPELDGRAALIERANVEFYYAP
jgi:hypothetical protein